MSAATTLATSTTWFVTSPTYPVREYVEHMLAQVYDISDFAEVQAPTRRDAVSLAVRGWLAEKDTYAAKQRQDGLCPFTGVRAQSEVELKTEMFEGGPPDWAPEFCDWGPCVATRWIWVDDHPDPDLKWGWFSACDVHAAERDEGGA